MAIGGESKTVYTLGEIVPEAAVLLSVIAARRALSSNNRGLRRASGGSRMGVQPERHSSINWRKSSYSADQGDCVETATQSASVLVRDSKDYHGLVLEMAVTQWKCLLAHIKDRSDKCAP
jgi:hypothetical protein